MKILLVEDHPLVAEISCELLRSVHDHTVEHVTTAAGAVEAASWFQPDMVLIDVNLPDRNGYELAAELRLDGRFQQTILVALTGFGGTVDSRHAASVGIDAHFAKPMDFGLLPSLKRAQS